MLYHHLLTIEKLAITEAKGVREKGRDATFRKTLEGLQALSEETSRGLRDLYIDVGALP